jgi:hypothetical protein
MAYKASLAKIIAVAYKLYKADRGHLYKLRTSWQLLELREPVPDYEGRNMTIIDSVIVFHPCTVSDGATLAPDKIGKSNFVPGAIGHDILYDELEEIAKAFGWTVAQTRLWADNIFTSINSRNASRFWTRVYHTAVRKAGGVAHFLGKLFITIALLGVLLTGCGGCATPVEMFVDGELEKPDYELVIRGE